MNSLNQWMQSDWLKALGWTFVHSLWQIACIGLILYVILRLVPGRSAHTRYTISTMAIWGIVIAALSTFIIMLPDSNQVTEITGSVVLMASTEAVSLTDRLSAWLELRMPMMLTVWLGGVMILMIRLLLSLGWVAHMRADAILSNDLQGTLDKIIQRLHIKLKPVVSESKHISSPVTIGHLKPLILFPIGIVNQLTPAEVEAILTHELAHIVRRDYLSNLIQSFIETLFYYHPVTWWISRMVRMERENRADDLAVSWCGDHLAYAKALMTVQEMQADYRPSLAIGFASRKGAMLARIQRILHIPYKNHNQMEKTVLLSLCSLCFLAFTITGDAKNEQADKKEDSTEIISVYGPTDTIPSEGTYRIHKKTDKQEINIEVENGDIKELKIDGKEIAPAEFDQYDDIIDELFGEIEAPPTMEGFHFEMPHMPAMPPMPAMPDMSLIPGMAPLPPMPPMSPEDMARIERDFMLGSKDLITGNGYRFKIINDSLDNVHTKIIIVNENGDSNVIVTNGFGWGPHGFNMEDFQMDTEEWEAQQKAWQEMSEDWKQNWEQNSEQWKQNWEEQAEEWKEQWRSHQDEMREHHHEIYGLQEQLREEGGHFRKLECDELLRLNEGQMQLNDQQLMELEKSLEALGEGKKRVYGLRAPRMNMTDAMVEDGLIDRGEEALIQLTPEKLKINGKKMDDETHEKYLRMYEAQQGIELTGNSRVEFRTKSRRSM